MEKIGMTESEARLVSIVEGIAPLDEKAMAQAADRLDILTKPPGSLGKLEELAKQLAGITGTLAPKLDRKAVVVMAGDHGVCEEGVSAFPAEVTPQMIFNMLSGGAAVNVFARQMGARVLCVDVGVNAELSHPDLLSRKVRMGTGNMAKTAAMTREEAVQALLVGVDVAASLAADGTNLLATGDMGIGNTTPSAALLAVLGNVSLEDAVGRGTGVDDERLAHKRQVVEQALRLHAPNAADPIGVLAQVGGLEIAGLAGLIIGAASHRRPILIDGFISCAAALVAVRIAPAASGYIIASHLSDEKGHRLMLDAMGLEAMAHLHMRLGEGTGALLCMPFVEAAIRAMNEMATFESAGVSGAE